jgi:hypothetical protein
MLLPKGVVVKNSGGHPVCLSVREKACLHRLTPESSFYGMPTVSIMASFLFVGNTDVTLCCFRLAGYSSRTQSFVRISVSVLGMLRQLRIHFTIPVKGEVV